jgi:hypothetical protein
MTTAAAPVPTIEEAMNAQREIFGQCVRQLPAEACDSFADLVNGLNASRAPFRDGNDVPGAAAIEQIFNVVKGWYA